MGELFHNWRRMAGCVTLAVACVLMSAWIRSYRYHDLLWLETTYLRGMVYSSTGGINVWHQQGSVFSSPYGWSSEKVDHDESGSQAEYWQIVIPLVLLSAYLICWNSPKRSNQ